MHVVSEFILKVDQRDNKKLSSLDSFSVISSSSLLNLDIETLSCSVSCVSQRVCYFLLLLHYWVIIVKHLLLCDSEMFSNTVLYLSLIFWKIFCSLHLFIWILSWAFNSLNLIIFFFKFALREMYVFSSILSNYLMNVIVHFDHFESVSIW